MNEKKAWISIIGGGCALAAGAVGLIYMEKGKIEELRNDVSAVQVEIDTGRKLIAQTPALEKEVIIQRETDSVIAEILPSDEDINNFVRTLREFEEQSGVRIVEVKKKNLNVPAQNDFDRVSYTLKFDADIFQLLTFTNQVDNHPRFMTVPAFKLTAARRKADGDTEEPRHKVQMDVETYVYAPQGEGEEVRIDGYDRKRELLLSEISRRRGELTVAGYDYLGARGRRDPWVDPRVPVPDNGKPVLTIEEQILLVDDLVERAERALELWEEYRTAENLIAEMKSRADLEKTMTRLDDDIRRVIEDEMLVFVSAERRFQKYVVEALDGLRAKLSNSESLRGPSVAILNEAIETMERHLGTHEYEYALRAFDTIEPRLQLAEDDTTRAPLVERLRWLQHLASTVIEFDEIELEIIGIAIIEGLNPVALINGVSLAEGEMVDSELFIRSIREDEIEFVYRGVILSRRIQP